MQTGDNTTGRREIAYVKEGNCTPVADDIDWYVSQFDCFSKWNVVNCYLVILNRRHQIVASQIGHQVKPYSLSMLEILSSTCSVKQRLWYTTLHAR
jgi:hypothetical protein